MLTRPAELSTRFARQGLRAAVFATAAAGLAVACSSSGGGSTGAAAPASAAPTTAAAATSAPAAGAAGNTITATETEFKIALSSSTLTAGTYTFNTVNSGQATHALEIDGPGVEDKSTGPVDPGASKALTVTLQKGSYEIYCPVGNHKAMGMDLHVTVA